MPKLDLSSVTLFCADCYDAARVVPIIERCKSLCNFGAVKLMTSCDLDYEHVVKIKPLTSHVMYSVWMVKKAYTFVDTEHMLVVQHDGWILNPDVWNPSWLSYDYLSPLFIHNHQINALSVGQGGFSFRSRRLMEWIANRAPAWDETPAGTDHTQAMLGSYEDGVISLVYRHAALAAGFKYASPEEASKFGQGGQCDPAYYVRRPFGFHGMWPNINQSTGIVEPWEPRP